MNAFRSRFSDRNCRSINRPNSVGLTSRIPESLSTYPGMGLDVLLDCFVVIVVGGFGSLFGAFVASLMIGELQSFGVLWVPRLAMVFQFLLMVGVLITRPTGLFGEKE